MFYSANGSFSLKLDKLAFHAKISTRLMQVCSNAVGTKVARVFGVAGCFAGRLHERFVKAAGHKFCNDVQEVLYG